MTTYDRQFKEEAVRLARRSEPERRQNNWEYLLHADRLAQYAAAVQ